MVNFFNKKINMHEMLKISYDEMDSFLEKIKDRPYYIPGKEELLKRAEDLYFEMTPQLTALRDYVLKIDSERVL